MDSNGVSCRTLPLSPAQMENDSVDSFCSWLHVTGTLLYLVKSGGDVKHLSHNSLRASKRAEPWRFGPLWRRKEVLLHGFNEIDICDVQLRCYHSLDGRFGKASE